VSFLCRIGQQSSLTPNPIQTQSPRATSQTGDIQPAFDDDGLLIPAAPNAPAWPPSDAPTFLVSELNRQVNLGVRRADVQDYEVLTALARVGETKLIGRQRTLLYLEPRDELYFSARGRAVAVLDYELQYTRVAAPEGATACVETPKDVIQCI
jgi:hypothetical protein